MKSKKIEQGVEIENIISDQAIKMGFKIGSPTDLEIILTDESGAQYQADVFLKKGWTPNDLQLIIETAILNCDYKVKKITSTFKGAISNN